MDNQETQNLADVVHHWFEEKKAFLNHMLQIPESIEITSNDVALTDEQRVGFIAGIQFVLENLDDFPLSPNGTSI
jgi:hypothetical protein